MESENEKTRGLWTEFGGMTTLYDFIEKENLAKKECEEIARMGRQHVSSCDKKNDFVF